MSKKAPTKSLIPIERVERKIYLLREEKVMFDSDLAELYGSAKRLNEQVKRNRRRFPDDFMFQLTAEEAKSRAASSSPSKQRLPVADTPLRSWLTFRGQDAKLAGELPR